MKKIILVILSTQVTLALYGQNAPTFEDTLTTFFKEIETTTKKNEQLWNRDLYGPILLVNPETRQCYANVQDSTGVLNSSGRIWTGLLPQNVNMANTSVNWSGVNWAMVMLPLPANKQDRINLLAHELFHRAQPSLGFSLFNTDNNHLDQKNGRIYLRLELEALRNAVQAPSTPEAKSHVTNALIFRKYRYLLYPKADSTENLLELNEGIAEYTGMMISGRTSEQAVIHFEKSIDAFLANPTFVRSFAYQTIPIYGYFLQNIDKYWNKRVSVKTNLTDFLIEEFRISIHDDLKKTVESITGKYNGDVIISEEIAREEKTKQLIAEYKRKFIEQPHLEIPFEQMNVSFDPGNIIPLEDNGTVYPNMRVTDKWGILTVKNGALMSPAWDKLSVSLPTKMEERLIIGDGWILELSEGYGVLKDENSSNYKLIKK